MAEKPCLGGIERKGSGNEYLITLLRKAGFACRPFLGGKYSPEWNPQRELCHRRNASVYSSVSTSRNPDFDLGIDFVDTLKRSELCGSDRFYILSLRK